MKSLQYLCNRHLTFIKSTFVAFGLVLACGVSAHANTISIVGNSTGNLATGTVNCSFDAVTHQFMFTITNTSPFDARITGIGFDLIAGDFTDNSSSGLNGFSLVGAPVAAFHFTDGALGNVSQFSNAVLDFGFTTGPSGNFNGGFPNDGIAPGASLTFTVTGAFPLGMTEAQICNAIFVRFQRVGANGEGSDVAIPGDGTPRSVVPEPASLVLIGSGLSGLAFFVRKRRRR